MDALAEVMSGVDLSDLDKPVKTPSSLKRIRDVHHRIARRVAAGKGTGEIAQELGYSMSRISILKGDPAFQQLVEVYRKRLDEIEDDIHAKLYNTIVAAKMEAWEHILTRMDEQGEDMPLSEHRQTIELANNELGLSATRIITTNVDMSRIAQREALGRERQARLIAPADGAVEGETASSPARSSPPLIEGERGDNKPD